MPEARSAAVLPRGARAPLRVWVNGIEQQPGDDYTQQGDRLVFEKSLAKEGRLGFWRWLMLLLGVHGTYRKNDCVDVQYETRSGQTRLATGLDLEQLEGS